MKIKIKLIHIQSFWCWYVSVVWAENTLILPVFRYNLEEVIEKAKELYEEAYDWRLRQEDYLERSSK